MANVFSTLIQNFIDSKTYNNRNKGAYREKVQRISESFTAANIANGNVLAMLPIKREAIPISLRLANTDFDTNGSPTIVVDVGLYVLDAQRKTLTAVDSDYFATAITQLQSAATLTEIFNEAGRAVSTLSTPIGEAMNTTDGQYVIAITVTTGAATAAAGDITMELTVLEPN